MKKYFRVWKQLAVMASESYMSNRIEYGSYFLGKIIRFCFLMLMIAAIFSHTGNMAGYTKYQVIIFFLTSFLIDTLGQAAFRGVYLFREDVRQGNFDYTISKPLNSLFLVLSRLPDFLDVIFIFPLVAFLFYAFSKLDIFYNPQLLAYYPVFLMLSFLMVAGIHVISVTLTMWTMESESFIWVLRNTTFLSLFPPEVYSGSIQLFFTFVFPIIVIFAFPAKVLLGLLTLKMALVALAMTFVFFGGSLLLWKTGLKHYSSASS
ncbi:MAG: ABC-2 family transporter protein [Candidatus Moranbacteria bacterium]|nr:ABC-2 family transporter protein [Candidatus Moranbacteria bacterium]